MPRLTSDDERFARIARAATPGEVHQQANELEPQLIVIDGDRHGDDVLDVIAQARASGRSWVIAVHVGQRDGASTERLRDAGAHLLIRSPGGRTCATLALPKSTPDLPFRNA